MLASLKDRNLNHRYHLDLMESKIKQIKEKLINSQQ